MNEQDPNQQPRIQTTPYASPMHMYQGSIIMLTNPDDEIQKMELSFRNKKVDKKGNILFDGEPLMNDAGINSIVGEVQALVNRVSVLSNFEEEEIPKLVDFLGDTLARDLMINRVTYGIKDKSARDKIYFAAISTAFVTLKRALDQGEKRFWKGSTQEILTRVEGLQGQKKKGLGSILSGAWGSK